MATTSEVVYVTIKIGGTDFKYGYRMPRTTLTALKADCGITEYGGAAGVFFGCNTPKPWRATKYAANGTTNSSFASDAKLAALRKDDNYNLQSPQISLVSPTTNPNYKTVYIEVPAGGGNTIKYAWGMKKSLFDAAAAELGIQAVTANDVSVLVTGINSPRLPRASKRVAGRMRETFITAKKSVIDKAVAAGWSVKLFDFESIDDSGG